MKAYRTVVIAVALSLSTALLMGCGPRYAVNGSGGGGAEIGRTAGNTAQASVSFQLFYDELSPYGRWVDYPNYGYVWIPDVDRGFSPYGSDGHWIYTYDGWAWVSNYSWGWAPFHYGRWAYDNSYGWLWVPNNEWGPAWVTWRRSEGYYGWAPMEPGISIEVSFGGRYRAPNERWIFVRDRDFGRTNINNYYINQTNNLTIINNSTVINNTYIDNNRHTTYVAGPARDDVQRITGAAIRPVAIRDNDKPGQTLSNDQLQIYRPRVQTINNNDHKPVPSKVVNLRDVKPVSERKPGNQRWNENLPPNGKDEPSQPQDANPSDNGGRDQQPRIVNPPDRNKGEEQPLGPPNANPSDNKGRGQQPRFVNPPDRDKNDEQPLRPQDANPSDNQGRGQQPRIVNPPEKGQPSQPQDVGPSDSTGREQQSRRVSPPNKGRPLLPQDVGPSDSVTSTSKKIKAQPRINQGETDKKKRGR